VLPPRYPTAPMGTVEFREREGERRRGSHRGVIVVLVIVALAFYIGSFVLVKG
jgi:ribosomal protein S6E (S10)